MTTQPHLYKLNDVTRRIIWGKLDFKSILRLRKVSHAVRNYIDIDKPELHLEKICIQVNSEKAHLVLFHGYKMTVIDYQKNENGCLVLCNGQQKLMAAEDYSKMFIHDLQIILNHQNAALELFSLSFGTEQFDRVSSQSLTNLNNILKTRQHLLKVKSLNMRAIRQEQALQILPYLYPSRLKEIWLRPPNSDDHQFEIDDIVKLEQWKQAEELNLKTLTLADLGSVESFKHFLKSQISLNCVTSKDVLLLKDAFLQSPNFDKCSIKYINFEDQEHLLELLGRPSMEQSGEINERQWRFQAADSERKIFLSIKSSGSIEFSSRSPTRDDDVLVFCNNIRHIMPSSR